MTHFSDAPMMSKRSKHPPRMKSPNLRTPVLTVWDPGAVARSNKCNNNRISHNHTNSTKDLSTNMKKHPKLTSTRASPNKSQDSGFSDSGDSETSSSIRSSDNRPHVTRVYFYSSNNLSEGHYQSPSSLPIFPPSSTTINNNNNKVEDLSKKFVNSVSVQDISKNKDEKIELRGPTYFSSNKKKQIMNEKLLRKNIISAPISYECNNPRPYSSKLGSSISGDSARIFEESCLKPESGQKSVRINSSPLGNHRNIIRLGTDTQDKLSEPEINRMNSITVLLNEFRKEDSSYGDDKHARIFANNSCPVSTTSSISLPSSPSISEFSDNSSFSSGSSNFQPLKRNPIDHWLSELPSLCESECSVMLQSKSLAGPDHSTTMSRCQLYQDVKIIQEQARQVSKSFADLCK